MEKDTTYADFSKKVKADTTEYISGIFAASTNISQRFIAFFAFTQFLYFFLFIVSKIFWWFEWYMAIRGLILTCFGVGIIFLFLFLFMKVNAKALTFFLCSIAYFFISLLIAWKIRVESFTDLLAGINDISFLGGWAVWNLLFSIIILLIGTARTFLLGFVYDYRQKNE